MPARFVNVVPNPSVPPSCRLGILKDALSRARQTGVSLLGYDLFYFDGPEGTGAVDGTDL